MTKEKITYVITVDRKDKEIGREEKLKAHQERNKAGSRNIPALIKPLYFIP